MGILIKHKERATKMRGINFICFILKFFSLKKLLINSYFLIDHQFAVLKPAGRVGFPDIDPGFNTAYIKGSVF